MANLSGKNPKSKEIGWSLEAGEDMLRLVTPRSLVTIVDRFGTERKGRAVMRGNYGWVLNMGGRYGTPDIASPRNIVRVAGTRFKLVGHSIVKREAA